MFGDFLCVIPAYKKVGTIPDQLVKKLDNKSLFERSLREAIDCFGLEHVVVYTDSHEISFICKHFGVTAHVNPAQMPPDKMAEMSELADYFNLPADGQIVLWWPDVPLIRKEQVSLACETFLASDASQLIFSTNLDNHMVVSGDALTRGDIAPISTPKKVLPSIRLLRVGANDHKGAVHNFHIPEQSAIIVNGYEDWWVCERLLKQKRIVFYVDASFEIGLGHLARARIIAQELSDHHVIFVFEEHATSVFEALREVNYECYASQAPETFIMGLAPDLVINDRLNTEKSFIENLQKAGIKVVNFEDFGSGALAADLVINDIYEAEQYQGPNVLWGSHYVILRDEFDLALRCAWQEEVTHVFVSFGGSDPSQLSHSILSQLEAFGARMSVHFLVVIGTGNKLAERIMSQASDYAHVSLFYNRATMSDLMERCQLAISSNGRTVFELADMNLPAIIVSHHEREAGHDFSQMHNGFVNLGIVDDGIIPQILAKLKELIEDKALRASLAAAMDKHDFRANKARVKKLIEGLL